MTSISEAVLGFPVSTLSLAESVDTICGWIEAGRAEGATPRYFVCANPHSLMVARADTLFASAIRAADLVVADGIGVVLASRLAGGKIRQRACGPDIFEEVCKVFNARGNASMFFLGSSPATLEKIKQAMKRKYPHITIAGTYSPPFKDSFSAADNDQMVQAINCVRPDILWVGMTAPKQEKWIAENLHLLDVAVAGPIGAVFDFVAGTRKRGPKFVDRAGLTWAVRLVQEPRRLWRRNLVSSSKFIALVLAQLAAAMKSKNALWRQRGG